MSGHYGRKVQRRTAYEVSFGESQTSHDTIRKRPLSPSRQGSGSSKRLHFDASNSYRAPEGVDILPECVDGELAPLWGEVTPDNDTKPIRLLTEFCIYDANDPHAFVSLKELEGNTSPFKAAGYVAPKTDLNDEDEAQEEEDPEDYRQYIELSALSRWSCSCDRPGLVVYIETTHAWYLLQRPSASYSNTYHESFLTSHLIAHKIVSAIDDNKAWGPTRDLILGCTGPSGKLFTAQNIKDSVWAIESALYNQDDPLGYLQSDLIRFCGLGINSAFRSSNQHMLPEAIRPASTRSTNIDNDALTRQSRTMVTPRILDLCEKYFPETLTRLGRRVTVSKLQAKAQKIAERTAAEDFGSFCRRFHGSYGRRRKIEYSGKRTRDFIESVTIDNEIYEVGNVIVVPWGKDDKIPVPEIPEEPKEGDCIEDFFWFGKIIYIDLRAPTAVAHVQWLWHSKYTMLQEIGSSQELFYCDKLCGPVPLSEIMGRVIVHDSYDLNQSKPLANEYYCRYYYLPDRISFVSIKDHEQKVNKAPTAPDNCHSCRVNDREEIWQSTVARKHDDAISCHGHYYHVHDFVLIRRPIDKKRGLYGPADIGYIVKVILLGLAEPVFVIRRVGRMNEVSLLPKSMNRDEKHLFITDEVARVSVADFIQPIHVLPCLKRSLDEDTVQNWLSASPDHFYMHYSVPSIKGPMVQPETIDPKTLPICAKCMEKSLSHVQDLDFLRTEEPSLSILDLFAGCGAFSIALAEGHGNARVTHAVEISPSACETIKFNSPDTKVYNNCANDVLQYAKSHYDGLPVDPPAPLHPQRRAVSEPPKPGDIDIITAGFPCQSHSSLNQYKQHSDAKNSLILTSLSWVDFLRPSYAYFENVPGFMSYTLKDGDGHEVDMGGIKLTVQAMLDLGYQVRFALLEAGHYGTPQRRRRFFMVAAKVGLHLPALPQPTHDFPESTGLDIRILPAEGRAAPMRTTHGVALHKYVSLADAIGDLPLFNWKDPQRSRSARQENNIPEFSMSEGMKRCGFDGAPPYRHKPQTTVQIMARRRESKDLQHFTKWMSAEKIQRVRGIHAKTANDSSAPDYRTLPRHQQAFQTYNPASAAAKQKHRPGAYRKLETNGVFPTVTTNIDPTAKQNQCLHPECLRIVTVRELARAQGFPDDFVFKSLNDVITMHRQIGNAVSWPIGRALGRELAEARLRDNQPSISKRHES